MHETRDIMGMPIAIDIVEAAAGAEPMEAAFSYFTSVDERFSPYKSGSEISRINRDEVPEKDRSADMQEVLALAERTKRETGGYFDVRRPDGALDPSGIVKGWAIRNAAEMLKRAGITDFYIDAGGDIAAEGLNAQGKPWSVGIRNPFDREKIAKVIYPQGRGVATSGTYLRGQHIYDPHEPERPLTDIVSLTVIGPDALEADRFATAAFAMGRKGIEFIESLPGFEGYQIDRDGIATMTSGFARYTTP